MDIAFMADKGGVGKTTLAYHVAGRLAQLGRDVAIMDLDQRATSLKWGQMAGRPPFPVYALVGRKPKLPDHDIRIWDTPAHPSLELQENLAKACEVVLVVAQTDYDSQTAAAELCAALRGRTEVRVLFNGIMPKSTPADSIAILRRQGVGCLDHFVRRYRCFEHCRWEGKLVCDYPYSAADNAWSDIAGITAEILGVAEVIDAAA